MENEDEVQNNSSMPRSTSYFNFPLASFFRNGFNSGNDSDSASSNLVPESESNKSSIPTKFLSFKEEYFDEIYEPQMHAPNNPYQFNLVYSCAYCRANLAVHSDIISRSFQGSHGRAYLFDRVVNVAQKSAEQRLLLTGLHAVADIYCECCKHTLGWKYERAYEKSQKYKEGRFIIEQAHMVKTNNW